MLRSTFYSFETARQALRTSQLGLDTVGHNMANVNTDGYTRQRVDQVSVSLSGVRAKYGSYRLSGQGSSVVGISQIRDPYLDNRYRTETTTAGEYAALSTDLDSLNKIFDEIMTTGAYHLFGEFMTQLDKLAADASSSSNANAVYNAARSMFLVLNDNMASLDHLENQIEEEMGSLINDINTILEQIAYLNGKIKEDNFYGNPSNELNDQRNLLIDQLSEYLNIDVHYNTVQVTSDLSLQELSITIKGTDITLVDRNEFNGLRFGRDETNPPLNPASVYLTHGGTDVDLRIQLSDGTYTSKVDEFIMSGALRGHLKMLNGMGAYASQNGESTFRGIPYYRQLLNDFATTLADTVNDWNAIKIYDNNGELQGTIRRDLFVSNETDANGVPVPLNAYNISVSTEWEKNKLGYITTAAKDNAIYTAVTTNPALVDGNGDPAYVVWLNDPQTGIPIETGIIWDQIAGVDSDGFLIDGNGTRITLVNELNQPIDTEGNVLTIPPDTAVEMRLEHLQRAITESVKNYDFSAVDYIWTNPFTGDTFLALWDKSVTPPVKTDLDIATDIEYYDSVSSSWLPITDINDIGVRTDGTLYYVDASGNECDLQNAVTGQPINCTDLINTTGMDQHNKYPASHYANEDGYVQYIDPVTNSQTTLKGVVAGDLYISENGWLYNKDGTPVVDANGNNIPESALVMTYQNPMPYYTAGDPTPNDMLPGAGKNDNLLQLKVLLGKDTQHQFGHPNNSVYKGTFQGLLSEAMENMAYDQNIIDLNLQSSLTVLDGLYNSREAISGVSMDEEAVNMMIFQNYYNAAARYMTVLDEAVGTIIQSMGVVGR